MAGKQVAPEVKGEFSKGNEPLQELLKLNTEAIVDRTEYPEVQRKDQDDTVKATPYFLLSKTEAGRVDIPAGFFRPSSGHHARPTEMPYYKMSPMSLN